MAKDRFHDVVIVALQKEGWTITDDPFQFKVGGVEFAIDLFAEKEVIAAQKDNEKIAVEIKTFLNNSRVSALHVALGQYLNYQAALQEYEKERTLYLAIPQQIYKTFFQLPFVQKQMKTFSINLLTYDTNKNTIIKWKKY